jgi:hypothetical protein
MWFQNERKFDEKLKIALVKTVDHSMDIYLNNLKSLSDSMGKDAL